MECYCSSLRCIIKSNVLWIAAFQFYIQSWLTSARLCVYLVNLHLPEKKKATVNYHIQPLSSTRDVKSSRHNIFWPFYDVFHFFEWAELTKNSFQGCHLPRKFCPFNNGGVLALKQYLLCKRCGFRYHYPLFVVVWLKVILKRCELLNLNSLWNSTVPILFYIYLLIDITFYITEIYRLI